MKRRGTRHVRSEEAPEPVRALEASAPYSSRLSARSALYADLHVLLDTTSEALSSTAYRSLVVGDNCVARKSVAARGKIWEELKKRYILDTGHPLFVSEHREVIETEHESVQTSF